MVELTASRKCVLSSGSKKDMGQDGQSYRANMALLATKPIPGKWFTWKKERSALQVCYRVRQMNFPLYL